MNALAIMNARNKLAFAALALGALMLVAPSAHHLALNTYQVWIFQWIIHLFGIGLMLSFTFGEQINHWAVKTIERLDSWLIQARSRANFLLVSLILSYTFFWCALTFLRHYYFHSQAYDLAIQDQVVWTTSQGHWFARSFEVTNDLGDHVRPYLALLSVLYLAVPSPYVLLAFQSFVLALSAWPLYSLAWRKFNSPATGLTIAFCALAYPPLGFLNRLEFHAEVIAVPLLIAAYERADANDLKNAGVFMGLALLGKENIGLSVSALGLVIAFCRKHWRFGFTWSVAGLAYSLIALFVIIPAFRGAPSDTLMRYQWLGSTPFEMLWTVLSDPLFIVKNLGMVERFLTLLQLLAPLAFIPLLSLPVLFPTVPTLIYNFLSAQPYQSGIYNQYMATVIPFTTVATVLGLQRLRRSASQDPDFRKGRLGSGHAIGFGVTLLLFATLGSWIYENPVRGHPYASELSRRRIKETGRQIEQTDRKTVKSWLILPNDAAIREGLKHVPQGVYLLTAPNYAPHLSHRRQIQSIPRAPVSALAPDVEAIFLNLKDLRRRSCDDYLQNLQAAANAGFGVTFYRDGVIVIERGKGYRDKLDDLLARWPLCH
jgi:uncharacterized membrane protein